MDDSRPSWTAVRREERLLSIVFKLGGPGCVGKFVDSKKWE